MNKGTMKKYTVQIIYTFSEQVEVESENEKDAKDLALIKASYNPNEFDDVRFEVKESL